MSILKIGFTGIETFENGFCQKSNINLGLKKNPDNTLEISIENLDLKKTFILECDSEQSNILINFLNLKKNEENGKQKKRIIFT
jgi:hypothetical protein